MAKLSKEKIELHKKVMELVNSDHPLSFEEKVFILENFQESANHLNSLAGAFFTPYKLARDFCVEIPSNANIIDLCAGIGMLAFQAIHLAQAKNITCIEINPDYVKVGKRVLPEANWIQADVLSLTPCMFEGTFDVAISNPPFGNIKTHKLKSHVPLKYRGSNFEFKVIEQAMKLAKYGVFVVLQTSVPFAYSGKKIYQDCKSPKHEVFFKQTGLTLEMNCGIDVSAYKNQWHGVAPKCEIATVDHL